MGSGHCRQEAASAGHPQHRLAPPRLAFFRRGLRDHEAVERLRVSLSGPLRLEETKIEIPRPSVNPRLHPSRDGTSRPAMDRKRALSADSADFLQSLQFGGWQG